MRIAAVSDIHVRTDGSDNELVELIRNRVVELSPDVFVIAGDISHSIDVLSQTLSDLSIPDIPKLFIPGNHDIWFEEDKGLGSLDKYSKTIGEECKKNDFIHLPDEPYIIDDVGFIGSIGWSDYSFRRDELDIPEEAYRKKEYKGALWNDFFNIDWSLTDQEATDLFNKKIEYDLDTLPDNIDTVVFVSHHLPFKDLTLYKDKLPWDFFSAYMGAISMGELLLQDGRVKLSISGHSHIRSSLKVNGCTAITVPIGYGRPEDGDFLELVKRGIADIQISKGSVILSEFVEGDICAGMPYVF